jgi:L-threonylcarbamoyladenylate synthase
MTRVLPSEPFAVSLREAAAALVAGGLAAFRTDTLYGVSASPMHSGGLARLRALKLRETDGAFVSLAATVEAAFEWSGPAPAWARELAEQCWPGPVTLVLPAGERVPRGVRAPDGSWAVRVPNHRWCRALSAGLGAPLPSTSANLPGARPARSAGEVLEQLGAWCELVVDGGEVPAPARASALVDARSWPPRLLRGDLPALAAFVRSRDPA